MVVLAGAGACAAAPLALTLTGRPLRRRLGGPGLDRPGGPRRAPRRLPRSSGAEAAVVVYRQDTPDRRGPRRARRPSWPTCRAAPGADQRRRPAGPARRGRADRPRRAHRPRPRRPRRRRATPTCPSPPASSSATSTSSTCPTAPRPRSPASGPVWHDFNAENEEALHLAELLSGLPTVILLFVAFGSAIAAGLPAAAGPRRHRRRLRRPPPRHRRHARCRCGP